MTYTIEQMAKAVEAGARELHSVADSFKDHEGPDSGIVDMYREQAQLFSAAAAHIRDSAWRTISPQPLLTQPTGCHCPPPHRRTPMDNVSKNPDNFDTSPERVKSDADREALARIVAGLDGVTPGPWRTSLPDDTLVLGSDDSEIAKAGGNEDYEELYEAIEADAAHIARCDPDTIRSIAGLVSAQDAEIARLREVLARPSEAIRSDAISQRNIGRATIRELKAENARMREALEAVYETAAELAETDDKAVRGWIEVTARNALADAREIMSDNAERADRKAQQ